MEENKEEKNNLEFKNVEFVEWVPEIEERCLAIKCDQIKGITYGYDVEKIFKKQFPNLKFQGLYWRVCYDPNKMYIFYSKKAEGE